MSTCVALDPLGLPFHYAPFRLFRERPIPKDSLVSSLRRSPPVCTVEQHYKTFVKKGVAATEEKTPLSPKKKNVGAAFALANGQDDIYAMTECRFWFGATLSGPDTFSSPYVVDLQIPNTDLLIQCSGIPQWLVSGKHSSMDHLLHKIHEIFVGKYEYLVMQQISPSPWPYCDPPSLLPSSVVFSLRELVDETKRCVDLILGCFRPLRHFYVGVQKRVPTVPCYTSFRYFPKEWKVRQVGKLKVFIGGSKRVYYDGDEKLAFALVAIDGEKKWEVAHGDVKPGKFALRLDDEVGVTICEAVYKKGKYDVEFVSSLSYTATKKTFHMCITCYRLENRVLERVSFFQFPTAFSSIFAQEIGKRRNSLRVYKKAQFLDGGRDCIVTLIIDNALIHATSTMHKARTNRAHVLSIEPISVDSQMIGPIDLRRTGSIGLEVLSSSSSSSSSTTTNRNGQHKRAVSIRDPNFVYEVGCDVFVPDYDENEVDCSQGVHFYFNKRSAELH